jgi:hypothetical protein
MAHDQKPDYVADDLTPTVGAATDIAPLGHLATKPAHELTADEDIDPVSGETSPKCRNSKDADGQAEIIIPATLFFVVYYFALPVLVGYAPPDGQKSIRCGEYRLPVRAFQFFMA